MRLRIWVAVCLIVMMISGCAPHEYTGTVLEPAKEVGDFTVATADGGTFDLDQPGDKTLLLYFGYTSCPDICPNTLFNLKRTMEALGDQADAFQVAMLTVDPERDTPERLDAYMKSFDPSYIGLYEPDTGQLAAIQQDFGIFAAPDSDEDEYTVSHSSYVFVMDEAGTRLLFSYEVTPEQMADDLKAYLKER
jgi:protein SCO1